MSNGNKGMTPYSSVVQKCSHTTGCHLVPYLGHVSTFVIQTKTAYINLYQLLDPYYNIYPAYLAGAVEYTA